MSPSGPRHSSVNRRNRSSSRSPIHSTRGCSGDSLATSARRNLGFEKLASTTSSTTMQQPLTAPAAASSEVPPKDKASCVNSSNNKTNSEPSNSKNDGGGSGGGSSSWADRVRGPNGLKVKTKIERNLKEDQSTTGMVNSGSADR